MNIQQIKQMVEDGFAARKIARDLGLNFDQVRKVINKNNYQLLKETFEESQISRIVSLYKQGISAKQLGFKFGIDKRRVQKWADKAGALRTLEQSHRLKFIDEHIFDVVDDQYKAYWLGFLYADAYNHEGNGSINLCLKGSDINHIKKYVNFFKGEEKDIFIGAIVDEDKEYPTCSYKIYSTHLSQKLKELGCPQAKSFIIKFPEWLSEDLKSHFVRGYFDGDGSIKMSKKSKEWRINICGTKELTNYIGEMVKLNINLTSSLRYISKTNNNTWILVISGNEQVKKFCDWMYQDANTYLDRKYERYLNLCNQQNNRKFLQSTNRKNYLLSNNIKQQIIDDAKTGISKKELSIKYGISLKTINFII